MTADAWIAVEALVIAILIATSEWMGWPIPY